MKQDIVSKIEQDFDKPQEVVDLLESMESLNRGPIPDRVFRSIVFLAEGNRDNLSHYIELACEDFRDVLWQAEYEDPEVRKYDFDKTFDELGL